MSNEEKILIYLFILMGIGMGAMIVLGIIAIVSLSGKIIFWFVLVSAITIGLAGLGKLYLKRLSDQE